MVRRSGNPGYQVGKPILSGLLKHKDPSSLNSNTQKPLGGTGGGANGVQTEISQPDWYIDRGNHEATKFLTVMHTSSATECPENGPHKRYMYKLYMCIPVPVWVDEPVGPVRQ